ncbi:IS3 family transposase [Bdellovibrio bacteriovorus]|uniref:IS3 family transposase n=1 Tax=Bdellovibrio bacteriovorus TaxID=959 RepID=UPI0035A99A48
MIFHQKKSKVGAKTIKMLLVRKFWINVNLKKVRRLMKLHGLHVVIRKRNKYNNFLAANHEHKICSNHLNRKFKVQERDAVYVTDVTSLNYGKGARAYLSAVKDLGTQEIVHHQISKSPNLPLVMNGLDKLLERVPVEKRRKLIIHSDQGTQYTSAPYRTLMKSFGVIQSMSRRGNCLDNAPIESFFGHMKDELDLKNCKTYEELLTEVDSFIYYYNNERPQWGLKGKTPIECRGFS